MLARAKVFENHIQANHASIAVKDDNQVFVAVQNVVKAAVLSDRHNYFKLLNPSGTSPFNIELLVLNHTQTLLAIVGLNCVTVADVKDDLPVGSTSPVWDCFSVSLGGINDTILSVIWNPASSKSTDIVVLTETSILLYDISTCFTSPSLVLQFVQYPALKGKYVSSIAFGSISDFPGSITLYVTTVCGAVFALFPFLSEGGHVTATKASVLRYLNEWTDIMEEFSNTVPPSALFNELRKSFDGQMVLFNSIRQQYIRKLPANASDSDLITITHDESFSRELIGPLAQLGSSAKIVEGVQTHDTQVLAVAHANDAGKVTISYLAQILPLATQLAKIICEPPPPREPQLKTANSKESTYKKPVRGFGYVVTSDSDTEEEDKKQQQDLAKHADNVQCHKIRERVANFLATRFNNLTTLSTDMTEINMSQMECFVSLTDKAVIVSDSETALVGFPDKLFSTLGSTPSFEVEYKQFGVSGHTTSYALLSDDLQGSGDYLLSYSALHGVLVFAMTKESERKEEPDQKSLDIKTKLDKIPKAIVLPAEELKLCLPNSSPQQSSSAIEFELPDSLRQVYDITESRTKDFASMAKFFAVFYLKLRVQSEDLRSQLGSLVSVKENMSSLRDITRIRQRIEEKIVKQEELAQRVESLQTSLLDRFEKIRLSRKHPASKAEKEWARELNEMNIASKSSLTNMASMQEKVLTLQKSVLNIAEVGDTHGRVQTSLDLIALRLSVIQAKMALEKSQSVSEKVKSNLKASLLELRGSEIST